MKQRPTIFACCACLALSGCGFSAPHARGTWEGRVAPVQLTRQGDPQTIDVPGIAVRTGPAIASPGSTLQSPLVGSTVTLVDEQNEALDWHNLPEGSPLKVTGLAWAVPVFDRSHKRLYDPRDPQQKYFVRAIQVKHLQVVDHAARK